MATATFTKRRLRWEFLAGVAVPGEVFTPADLPMTEADWADGEEFW